MRYISTRGRAPILGFEDAMLTGLARDGGLYVPQTIPQIPADQIAAMQGQSYEDVAFTVMKPFVGDQFDSNVLRELIHTAYAGFSHPARAPLKQLGSGQYLLELFHGPTLAFKDFAMQLIGQLFQYVLKQRGARITIIGATSGDTGSAAIEAFAGLDNVDVFILYPDGRVSEVQRRQMSTPPHQNVHALAVKGDFDDCQARLKDMFNDFEFRDEVALAGVNSINWARVLAQVVYYFTSALSVGAPERQIDFTVPTGNFGDVFAGYIARQMGLPIGKLVIATNQNDILHRALDGQGYHTSETIPSVSPSMDIQVSSNFERALFQAYEHDAASIRTLMKSLGENGGFEIRSDALDSLRQIYASDRVSEEQTLACIRDVYAQTGELLCPHSAVGVHVSRQNSGANPMITLATAHPTKFPQAVKEASGVHPPLPVHMADLYERPERITRLPNDLAVLQDHIRRHRTQ